MTRTRRTPTPSASATFGPSVFYRHLVEVDDDGGTTTRAVTREGKSSHGADVRSADVRSAYVHGHEVVACSADRVERLTLDFRKSSRRRPELARGPRSDSASGPATPSPCACTRHSPRRDAPRPSRYTLATSRRCTRTPCSCPTRSVRLVQPRTQRRVRRRSRATARVVLTRAEIAEAKRACGSAGRARPRVPTARRDTQTVGADRAAGAVHDPGGRRRSRPRLPRSPRSSSDGDATRRRRRRVRARGRTRRGCALRGAGTGRDGRRGAPRTARRVPSVHGRRSVPGARARRANADASRRRRRRRRRPFVRRARADPRGATEAQIRAAEQAVDALAVHSYDPSDISNPTLARHHRALESQALNRAWTADDDVAGDATEPPGRTNSPPWARANPWRRSRRRRTARITTRRWRRRWRRRAREEPNGKPRWAAV